MMRMAQAHTEFLDPRLTVAQLDTFVVRRSILQVIETVLPRLSGTLLDVGSGYQPYRSLVTAPPSRVSQYIGLDLRGNRYQRPDLEWDGHMIPLQESSIDCAIATEVLEHCPAPEGIMREIWRVLRPGGLLCLTVPFLWPLHTVPYDEYRYTPFALERHLHNAGFCQIELRPTGGWDRSMAQMLGLWARRRWTHIPYKKPRDSILRRVLPRVVLPVISVLDQADRQPATFAEGLMITGIAGIAYKPS
jgi:SAM-dependent methyltransferase